MTLVIQDTLSGEKRAFAPRDPGRVTMYVCGPTVYNYAHIGNARPVVVFDLLFRLLRHLYGESAVVYARNITDVDDKINKAAIDQGVPIGEITDRFTDAYHADMDALGALRPTIEPRATAHIEAMIAMIDRLVANNAAYAAEGHVLFDTQAFGDYGQLSKRTLDDMIAGARVEVAPYKRHPADFVLWKPSKPGEPVWESSWGPGRPGWHLECSAMVEKNLGLPIDIHGGGHDLIFPHHENEIAQSRCADHAPVFASYWMHNGFLTMDAEKMSKSLGNVLLVHDLVEQVPGEAIRWALLAAHYRAPLDWTGDLLTQSRKSLDRLYRVLHDASVFLADPDNITIPGARSYDIYAKEAFERLQRALLDDLNTPMAFSALFELGDRLRAAVRPGGDTDARYCRELLLQAGNLMGFLQANPDTWFEAGADEALKAKVEALLSTRGEARKAKDWVTADRIRDELTALNVVVMDGPTGATWRIGNT